MLGSTQQVARILFEKLQLTPGRKGKTGYSTDTRVLRSIRSEHEIVPVIEEWREYSKLLNTYLGPLPSLLSEADGRLHTTFNQTVASTGRLSTTNPNLQAIPIRTELGKEIRSAFVSESGTRLLSADYSQIELRILAHVSGRAEAARGVRARRRHPYRDCGRGARQGCRRADVRGPVDRQDDQLRDRLRHLGVRTLGESGDSARRGTAVHRRVPRALSARAGLHPAHDRAGETRRLRDESARQAPPDAGDPRVQQGHPLAGRAPRRELRHAGVERRHHQEGDDRDPPSPPRRGPRRCGSCSRCTTSCCSRCRRPRSAPCGSSSGKRCGGRIHSTRRWPWRSGSATTGAQPSRDGLRPISSPWLY